MTLGSVSYSLHTGNSNIKKKKNDRNTWESIHFISLWIVN